MKANVIYLSHGGGPMPLLGQLGHKAMIQFMKNLPNMISKPEAILVISAHWETDKPMIIASKDQGLLYDYYGFPEEAYHVTYPVKGAQCLADDVMKLLEENRLDCERDTKRGLDHGVFIPLMLMYPDADIPVCQLSLIKGLNPETHIGLGKALEPLLEQNILIIGSGFSFHNMIAFRMDDSQLEDSANNAFQDWVIDTCCGSYETTIREEKLIDWTQAPGARYCHPREEHLMPLHVCQGLASKQGHVIFDDYIVGKRCVAIHWS